MTKYHELNKCPKCGGQAGSKYIRIDEAEKIGNPNIGGMIERRCMRCDFVWWEEPLDSFDNNNEESNVHSESEILPSEPRGDEICEDPEGAV